MSSHAYFCDAGGYLDSYPSLGDLVQDLKAIDVLNGEYTAWDAGGRRVELTGTPDYQVLGSVTEDWDQSGLAAALRRDLVQDARLRLEVVQAVSLPDLLALWERARQPDVDVRPAGLLRRWFRRD